MGGHELMRTLPGALNIDAVRRHFEEWQAEDAHESGQGSYAGNWTTFRGLEFKNTVFQDEEAAREYISDYASKWGPAFAVRFRHVEVTVVKEPTFDGEPPEDGQRKCFKTKYGVGLEKTWVPADQLSEAQKARCLKLLAACHTAGSECAAAYVTFTALVTKLTDEPEWWDARALKKARTDHFKAQAKGEKAAKALTEFNNRMCDKLYKVKTEAPKTMWLVGGWAAS